MTHSAQPPDNKSFSRPRRPPAPLGLFAFVALLMTIDVVDDLIDGVGAGHLALELVVMAAAFAGAVLLAQQWARERRQARAVRARLGRARADADGWRAEAEAALRGLGEALDQQFERWALTPAEREVALLLLKGLSLRDVASVRGTSERTARQQARAVYAKGSLAGRAELSAFFLEDLLLPSPQR